MRGAFPSIGWESLKRFPGPTVDPKLRRTDQIEVRTQFGRVEVMYWENRLPSR